MLLPVLLALFHTASSNCPPGLAPVATTTSSFQSCTPQDACSCYSSSIGAICQYSTMYSNYICCGSTSTQCGPNTSPQVTSAGQPVACRTAGECAPNYLCTAGICCPNLANSTCATGCLQGQIRVNGQCFNSVAIGSACARNEQCVGGASCVSQVCQCAAGYVNVNEQCVISNGVNCPLGTISYNSRCVSLAAPGESCVTNSQCIDNSACTNSVCTCPTSHNLVYGYCLPRPIGSCQNTQALINNQCVLYSIVGETCLADAQCAGGSVCIGGECACRSPTVAMYGYCINARQCAAGEVLVNAQCYPKAPVGGVCTFTQQCLNSGVCTNSICQSGVCYASCAANQACVGSQCLNYVAPGYQCVGSQQCLQNSLCINGVCACPTGTALQNGVCTTTTTTCNANQVLYNNQCYTTVSVGGQCQITQQCLSGSQCLNQVCQCPTGSTYQNGRCSTSNCNVNQVFYNNQCWNTVAVGGQCQITQQCLGNSQCLYSYCQCPAGTTNQNGYCSANGGGNCNANQVLYNGQCLNKVSIGSMCTVSQQCLGNSQCLNSYCQCGAGLSNVNGQCQTGNTANLCPSGQQVQLAANGEPINCLVAVCSTNSFCQYSAAGQRYVCCS
ncbi:unnamed protein product [Caenorhabditis bovis]|uniref:EB domain-containing protein n=1 Tax=Caenorhabditis bovis TaxID=2654633 RepID=A0A8S1EK30_9PELO|nr:unnamed protein product [Caenorhabditis bovis]